MSIIHQPSLISDKDNELIYCNSCKGEFMSKPSGGEQRCPICGSLKTISAKEKVVNMEIEKSTGKKVSNGEAVRNWCISFLKSAFEYACNPPTKKFSSYSEKTAKGQLIRAIVFIEKSRYTYGVDEGFVNELVFVIYTNSDAVISALMKCLMSCDLRIQSEFGLTQEASVRYEDGCLTARIRIEDFEEFPKVAWIVS